MSLIKLSALVMMLVLGELVGCSSFGVFVTEPYQDFYLVKGKK